MDAFDLKAELAIPLDAPMKAQTRKTYASFGEDGLTATASAYGHLIQITRYFGNEPSGFICVDLPGTFEPYRVTDRMQQLQRSCAAPHRGMRLLLPEEHENGSQRPDDLKWGSMNSIPKIQFYEDRWPCFITRYQWLHSEVQYFIAGKTVYQTYTFSSIKGMETGFPKDFPPLMISANLLLRHLDFVTEVNGWNSHSFDGNEANDHYVYDITLDTKAIFIKHKIRNTWLYAGKDAILFISPYIDNRSQSVGRIGQDANYEIKIDEQAKKDILKNKRVQITLAYTLELASSTGELSSPLSEYALQWLQRKSCAYEPPLFVDDKHLNFTLRRNLEHILSVCSIPIRRHDEPRAKVMPIALTCGDISGHRIAKEASFYAFQYLLKAFEHFDSWNLKDSEGLRLPDHPLELDHDDCENHNCRMRFRIWKTCLGHLTWISDRMNTEYMISNISRDGTTKEYIMEQGVGPHYWASGRVITEWDIYPSVFADREITDGPMQIIKFGEFYRVIGDEAMLLDIPAGIKSIARHWVRSLHERNNGGAYMYASLCIKKEQPRKFYLADHAFIWWASKSLEELGLESVLRIDPYDFAAASGQRIMRYSSDEIKTNFIKRFTMEDSVLKTRLIAISRSSAETRFSLSTRETVLFYAMDLGLFDAEVHEGSTSTNKHTESSSYDESTNNTDGIFTETNETSNKTNETLSAIWGNVIDEWTNTVNYQTQREDQHDSNWNHPLQFALSIILSTKNKSTEFKRAARMFDVSKKILFASSSPNGLFPGQLNLYKEPVLFQRDIMRDTYWQATFEVPFILWKYYRSPVLGSESSTRAPEWANSSIRPLENIIKSLPGMNDNRMPNTQFDKGKVVNISDEWLYNELECFENRIKLSESNIKRLSQVYESKLHMAVISKAAQIIQKGGHRKSEERILGYVINVPQTSNSRSNTFISTSIKSHRDLYEELSFKRTQKNASKRLLHFCRATEKTALICYMSAFEHPDISTFFDRHKAYSKFFHEEMNAALNLWATEFHLSFYQIISQNHPPDITCIPDFDYYDFPPSTSQKAGNLKQISRAVMSFRFDGDFLDHHWTCHFFEYNPCRINANEISNIPKENVTGSLKAHPWKQRRVLELVLFGKILQEMVTCSQTLLDEIKKSILEGVTKKTPKKQDFSSTFLDSIDIFDEMTSHMFKSANKSWNLFQYILQVVEEDLAENLTKIQLWMKREERPEHNQPQWTLKNERNYRDAIYRLQKSNDLRVQDLTLCYNRAKFFNASLRKGLESARDEWEIESNDDIRLFTYVTVVFLPISFATGVFSMSSVPTNETLHSMITTAGLALLATVIALLYAKVLYGNIVQPFFATLRLVIRIIIYPVRMVVRLAYLILISLLSILPSKWIYFLDRYSTLATEALPSHPYSAAYIPKQFLNEEIEEKVRKIKEKLVRGNLVEELKLAQWQQVQEERRRGRGEEIV